MLHGNIPKIVSFLITSVGLSLKNYVHLLYPGNELDLVPRIITWNIPLVFYRFILGESFTVSWLDGVRSSGKYCSQSIHVLKVCEKVPILLEDPACYLWRTIIESSYRKFIGCKMKCNKIIHSEVLYRYRGSIKLINEIIR